MATEGKKIGGVVTLVFAAFGAAAALINVYEYFNKPTSNLEAVVWPNSITTHPSVKKLYDGLDRASNPDDVFKWIKASNPKMSDLDARILASDIASEVVEATGHSTRLFSPSLEDTGFTRVEIRNTGDLPLQDVKVRIPLVSAAAIEVDGTKSVVPGTRHPTIPVGGLDPGAHATVFVWHSTPPSTFMSTKPNVDVLHAAGRGDVIWGVDEGLFGRFIDNYAMQILFAVLGSLFLIMIIGVSSTYRAQAREVERIKAASKREGGGSDDSSPPSGSATAP